MAFRGARAALEGECSTTRRPSCSAWRERNLSFLGQPKRGPGGQEERERGQESLWALSKERRWQGPPTDPPAGREWRHILTQWHPQCSELSPSWLPAASSLLPVRSAPSAARGWAAPREAGGKVHAWEEAWKPRGQFQQGGHGAAGPGRTWGLLPVCSRGSWASHREGPWYHVRLEPMKRVTPEGTRP